MRMARCPAYSETSVFVRRIRGLVIGGRVYAHRGCVWRIYALNVYVSKAMRIALLISHKCPSISA